MIESMDYHHCYLLKVITGLFFSTLLLIGICFAVFIPGNRVVGILYVMFFAAITLLFIILFIYRLYSYIKAYIHNSHEELKQEIKNELEVELKKNDRTNDLVIKIGKIESELKERLENIENKNDSSDGEDSSNSSSD